jgi:hypothetical protein
VITPTEKKSETNELCSSNIASGDIYPGVPEQSTSFAFYSIFAMSKSVSRRYPLLSNIRLSGLTFL